MNNLFNSITQDFILPFYITEVKLDIINNNIKFASSNIDKNDFSKSNDFYKQALLVELSKLNQFFPIFENVKEDIGKNKSGFFTIDNTLLCEDNSFENEHLIHRFAYNIKFNKNLNLYKYFEDLKLAFYFEHGINRLNGSFIFEKKINENLTYDYSIYQNYIYNLITNFFKKHFYPFDLERFNKLLNDDQNNDKFTELHDLWIEIIDSKVLNNSTINFLDKNIKELKEDLFYDMFNIWAISLSYIQLLNNLFTKTNYIFDNNTSNSIFLKSQESKEILLQINNILKEKFNILYHKETKKRTWLDNLSKLESNINNHFISEPSILIDAVPTIVYNNRNIMDYLKNDLYFEYFINILYPEYFQINFDNLDDYNSLENVKNSLKMFNKIDYSKYINQVKKTLCENNLYFFSFIKQYQTIIVSKNEEFHKNSNYKYLYIWSKIFIETKVKEVEILKETRVLIDNSTIRWRNIPFRKLMQDIKDITFNENSHFYGLKNISFIIDKYNDEFGLTKEINNLNYSTQLEDEIYKRGTERSNFVMVYIVAIIVGFINYFAMVYSATSDTGTTQNGWPGVDKIFPWVGTSLFFVVIIQIFAASILTFAFFRLMYTKHKYKQIDLHMFC